MKKHCYEYCVKELQNKQAELEQYIANAQESLLKEQKSTAGDKHETSRAMVQIEIDKYAKQLAQIKSQQRVLLQMNPEQTSKSIGLGSYVETNKGNFYFGVSLGKKTIEKTDVFFISLASPIGQAMLGKAAEESIMFNDVEYTVLDCF